jgi:hypothetical protein
LKNVYDSSLFTDLVSRFDSESDMVGGKFSNENENSKKSCHENENENKVNEVEENTSDNNFYPKIKDGFLRVKIPVAEVEGDFRMVPGGPVNEGRECETLVQVLQYGMYQVRTLQYTLFIYLFVIHFVKLSSSIVLIYMFIDVFIFHFSFFIF